MYTSIQEFEHDLRVRARGKKQEWEVVQQLVEAKGVEFTTR